jgi:uncharacterized protein (TIRG00374 family)
MDRRVNILVVSAALAVGIIAFMLLRVWGDLLVAIGHWNPLFLIPAIAFSTAGWWLRGARYRSILGKLGIRAGLAFSTACVLISQTANLIIPARLGDLVRIFILKHENLSGYPTGISSIIIERIFDILTVAILGLLALPFIPGVPPWVYQVIFFPFALFVLFVLLLILVAVRMYVGALMVKAIKRLMGRYGIMVDKVGDWIRKMAERTGVKRALLIVLSMISEMRKASLSTGSITVFSGLSIVIWLTDVLTTVSVALMFRAEVSPAVIVLAVVVGNLFKAVPVTPGGIGTYEAVVAVILVLSGTGQATATLIAVSDHLVKNVITAAGGVLSIRLLGTWVVDAIRDAFHGKGETGA